MEFRDQFDRGFSFVQSSAVMVATAAAAIVDE